MSGLHIVLVIVGVLLVGLALFVGVTQFKDNPEIANEKAISWDAACVMTQAEKWYKQGQHDSFEGITLDALGMPAKNDNGTFEIENATDKSFQLLATGVTDKDKNGKPLQFRLTYNALADTTTWEKVEE
jgi:hypothetical protein